MEVKKIKHRVSEVRHIRLMVLGSMLLLPMAGESCLDSEFLYTFCSASYLNVS